MPNLNTINLHAEFSIATIHGPEDKRVFVVTKNGLLNYFYKKKALLDYLNREIRTIEGE
jgi:hypothetical protein